MCKSSPIFYSFCVVILFGSLQLCSANNNWNSEQQQNRNGTEQEQLSMVDAPNKTEATSTSELQMVDAPTQNPNSSSRIEREGILVDIADLGGGRQSTSPKENKDNPEKE